MRTTVTDHDRPHHRAGRSLLLAVAGLMGLAVLAGCGSDPDPATSTGSSAPPSADVADEPTSAAAGPASAITCTTDERTPPPTGSTWKHPSQSFYDGTEVDLPGRGDLEHLLSADAAAVAHYDAARLPAPALDALRAWAESSEAVVALPADAAASAPVEVELLTQRLSCDGVDTGQLDAFVATRSTQVADPH